MTQTCCRCGVEKRPDGFHRDRRVASGRYAYCKECVSAINREAHARRNDVKVIDEASVTVERGDTLKTEFPTKVCNACSKDLPLTKFYSNRYAKDFVTARCRDCVRGAKRAADGKSISAFNPKRSASDNYRTTFLCQCADCARLRPAAQDGRRKHGGLTSDARRVAMIAARVRRIQAARELWDNSNQDDLPDDEKEIETTIGVALRRDREP